MQSRQIDLTINKLTKAQYDGILPNTDEVYVVTDDLGLTSSDITTALGYTPYNSTNPAGYTSNVGTVTSVNNTSPDGSGNVSISVGDTLPSQTGQSGKFLTTNGTNTSWETVSASTSWGNITGTLSDQTDLQNALGAKQDEATAVNYDNITNCLTEIPQDIKLELSSGTLTLKAGSKVYFGDGTSVTIESDLTTITTGAAQMYICKIDGGGIMGCYMTGGTVTERPSSPINYALYYNTTTNICEAYWSGAWHTLSFPIAIATRGSSGYESIDQVFNGFGYIGSTVFALPGIKGLIPNGRNADGTLKNISFENTTVKTTNLSNGNRTLIIQNGGQLIGYLDTAYYEDENIIKNSSGQTQFVCYLGHVIVESGAITRFETKSAFHAVDYSDSPTIAGWAMPSDRYIDLTLGSSGATYTAPANGYYTLSKQSSGNSQYISIEGLIGSACRSSGSSQTLICNLPVKNGQQVTVSYNAGGSTNYFRFIYAEGN